MQGLFTLVAGIFIKSKVTKIMKDLGFKDSPPKLKPKFKKVKPFPNKFKKKNYDSDDAPVEEEKTDLEVLESLVEAVKDYEKEK